MGTTLFRIEPILYQQYEIHNILGTQTIYQQFADETYFVESNLATAIFFEIHIPIEFVELGPEAHLPIVQDTIEFWHPSSFADALTSIKHGGTPKIVEYDNRLLHVFAKSNQQSNYTYLGLVQELQIYSGGDEDRLIFRLREVIPDNIARDLSGFKWEVREPFESFNKNYILHTYDTNEALEFAIKLLALHGNYGDVTITHFRGETLYIHLIDQRAYLHYKQVENRYIYVFDPTVSSDEVIDDPYGDTYDTIPLRDTILREDAMKVLYEFIETGQRPTCVKWRE